MREFVNQNFQPIIVNMAAAKRTPGPPYHAQLQPIECVWAIVKGYVGRRYTNFTTFSMVKSRLQDAFHTLDPKQIQGCINKAIREEECMWN